MARHAGDSFLGLSGTVQGRLCSATSPLKNTRRLETSIQRASIVQEAPGRESPTLLLPNYIWGAPGRCPPLLLTHDQERQPKRESSQPGGSEWPGETKQRTQQLWRYPRKGKKLPGSGNPREGKVRGMVYSSGFSLCLPLLWAWCQQAKGCRVDSLPG